MPVQGRAARGLAEAWRPASRTSWWAIPGPELMFDDRVYKRGALALHALRGGAATWRSSRCCTTGPDRIRHGSVSTAEFILTADRATGLDAEALLHPWLLRRGPSAAAAAALTPGAQSRRT